MTAAFEDVAAFPLCWPAGWPRTKGRMSGNRFADWTVYTATEGLMEELGKMGATNVIVSTSIPLRRDGLPLSKPPVDGDPGCALYFLWRKKPMCIACDRYAHVENNIRALTLTIEAMRAIERHGSTDLLNRAFEGFAALPAGKSCWEILGIPPRSPKAAVEAAYRALAVTRHPDKPTGSHEAMTELNRAKEEALAELEGK